MSCTGGAIAQLVEHMTPGQEDIHLINAPGACSLLVGSASV